MQNLMNPPEVKTSKLAFVLAVLLGLFFIPCGLWSLLSAVFKGFAAVPLFLGTMMLAAYGAVVWLTLRGYWRSVRRFTSDGVTRNDGRKFAWTELSRVVTQTRLDPKFGKLIWRIEVQFTGGDSAWLIPVKVKNFNEVRDFVNNLPCEKAEKQV
jgi:hypothetical protein